MTVLTISLVRANCRPLSLCSLRRTPRRSASPSAVGAMASRSCMMLWMIRYMFLWHLLASLTAALNRHTSREDGYRSTRLNPPTSRTTSSSSCMYSSRYPHQLPTTVRARGDVVYQAADPVAEVDWPAVATLPGDGAEELRHLVLPDRPEREHASLAEVLDSIWII